MNKRDLEKRERMIRARAVVEQVLGDKPWASGLHVTAKDEPVVNLSNALTALRSDEAWQGVLGYDELEDRAVLLRPIPNADDREPPAGFKPRPLQDEDITDATEWIQDAAIPKMSSDTMWQAIEKVARENRFHPVRDWLKGLVWDGTPRVHDWLHMYAGAERTPYVMGVGRMMLVALVARVFERGCKVDYVPILSSEQGSKKSTMCRIIGGEWSDDNMPDTVTSKDAQDHLRGKWLIELGELTALSKSEAEHLKAFVTRQVERFRPAYGRKEISYPRQCVFWGTTNEEQYLRDATGGRRFWPIKVGNDIDVDAVARDRDQLLAEAVHLYRQGEQWWPTAEFEREHIKPRQEDSYEADPWEDTVLDWVERQTGPRQAIEIACDAIGLERGRVGVSETRRIGAIMRRAGYKVKRRRGRNEFVRE